MLERLQYKNHVNEVIDFGQAGIFVSSNDLHDYSWTVNQKNNRISSFQREVAEKTLPIIIFCATVEDGLNARNRLLEVAEKDVLAKQPGRIIIGDYYFKCYITGSKKSSYLATRRRMEVSLTVTSDAPVWVKENVQVFRKTENKGNSSYYWRKYSVVQSIAETEESDVSISFRMTGVVTNAWDDADYSDAIEILDGSLSLVNPSTVTISSQETAEAIIGKYARLYASSSKPYYRIPATATVQYSRPSSSSYEYTVSKAFKLAVASVKGDFIEDVMSEESDTYPKDGIQDGYYYTYRGQDLDYSYDYPFDFTSGLNSGALNNPDFTASNFRMVIYGPFSNPVIYISGHAYVVNCSAETGEYITIDSSAKTITKTAVDGTSTNVFNLRGRGSYVFEKIPAGDNSIAWDGDFGVDVTILEERSEPKWT